MRLTFYLNIFIGLLLSSTAAAQEKTVLQLPFSDQLPSNNVMHIIEDSQGCLWYATEGGGICRNNGRGIDVFRSDADNPHLLGDNRTCCLAEHQDFIIIGTFHGAYALDKTDFSIKQLTEVDSKRIDDVITDSDSCIWLTANRKIYKYSKQLKHIATYPSQWKGKDVYTARICQDYNGQIWASQWNGGLLRFDKKKNTFEEAKWDIGSAPSAIVSDSINRCLWIGTTGQGLIKYSLEPHGEIATTNNNHIICIDMLLSDDGKQLWTTTTDSLLLFNISNGTLTRGQIPYSLTNESMMLNRLSLDHNGSLLVANSMPGPFAISEKRIKKWYDGYICDGNTKWGHHERRGLQAFDASTDTIIPLPYAHGQILPFMAKRQNKEGIWGTNGNLLIAFTTEDTDTIAILDLRPSAMADDGCGNVWIASNKGLSRTNIQTGTTEIITDKVKDVSALSCDKDGSLWLGTIYGNILHYKDGKITEDDYASDTNGDAITALSTDSTGCLMIAGDRYVRIYDTERHTMKLQNRTDNDTYIIELHETEPFSKWHDPDSNVIIERIPGWMGSWWMCVIYFLVIGALVALLIHYHILKKQRREFMAELKRTISESPEQPQKQEQSKINKNEQEWIEKAIAQVELNLANEAYNVEQLSADLCMSRMTFYRKIQALTGQKPSEFIRTIRLRRAAVMLQEGALTVTEISYATGFSSVSYFSRCFRTMFGVPPTQFGKNSTAEDLPPSETPS